MTHISYFTKILLKWRDIKGKIRSSTDLYAGLMFIFFGIFAMLVARSYPMGSAARMGPGYFPFMLGGILTLLGLIITVRVLWVSGESVKLLAMRPMLLVLCAVLSFGLLVEPLGLILATLALIVISCLGGWEFDIREVAFLYLVLVALAVGLFVYCLGLAFKVWPI